MRIKELEQNDRKKQAEQRGAPSPKAEAQDGLHFFPLDSDVSAHACPFQGRLLQQIELKGIHAQHEFLVELDG